MAQENTMPAGSYVSVFVFLEEIEEQATRNEWRITSSGGQQEHLLYLTFLFR